MCGCHDKDLKLYKNDVLMHSVSLRIYDDVLYINVTLITIMTTAFQMIFL